MQDISYSSTEKEFLYLLIYNYLQYAQYQKAITVIRGLPFHRSDPYLLKCLLYGYIMVDLHELAHSTIAQLRDLDRDLDRDGWFILMQAILNRREKKK